MSEPVKCPECGREMTYVERWHWWECACGCCMFTRFLTTPYGTRIDSGPYDVLREVKLEPPQEEQPR